ncbi:sensor histidine kinase [Robertmurraya massiliosenegalensis]|uniref:sensor histidine kinase n=1 Tax=Robertmurraya TaxID=2837507 RepID=UPI0039A6A66A
MIKKQMLKQKFSGISPYIWTIISILPFYFIFQSSSTIEIIIGLLLTATFFLTYRFAFLSKKWLVYVWTIILISISMTMTILFDFIYFAFYIAYYNGNIRNRVAFLTLYVIHLVFTTAAINYNLVMQKSLFIEQLPFVIIIWISVILLPFNLYNKKKQGKLEEQLEYANKRIAELVKQEERQRIARDLHDTLGQRLSLIGLKSDLARKLVYKDPEQARSELKDIQQTSRQALNEVRKMVSSMRGIRLRDELIEVSKLLDAAGIELAVAQKESLTNVSLFLENILSMCLKEIITNVVKHSQATSCKITISQSINDIRIEVTDNGVGIQEQMDDNKGSGLLGIRERLEFVNGSLETLTRNGTTIVMTVPNIKNIREGNRG